MAHNKVAEDAVTRQRIRNIDKKGCYKKSIRINRKHRTCVASKLKKNRSVRKAEERRIHNRDGSTGC